VAYSANQAYLPLDHIVDYEVIGQGIHDSGTGCIIHYNHSCLEDNIPVEDTVVLESDRMLGMGDIVVAEVVGLEISIRI
jgi:SOS-response transcriptional repressor LexA